MAALQDFVAMGGYGRFVWPAFLLTAVVMIALFWQSWRQYRLRRRELDALRITRERRR